ncbi:hypothetical protein D3C83_124900 [compost metagenome]
MLWQCRKMKLALRARRKFALASISARVLMPVEAISVLPVAAIAACSGKLVRSAEATLKACTPKESSTFTLVGSQGVHM